MLQSSAEYFEVNNLMVRMISGYPPDGKAVNDEALLEQAISHIEQDFAFVGVVEHMTRSVHELGRKLNWKSQPTEVLLKNVASNSSAIEINADTREAIEACNKLDLMLYDYVTSELV
ncbi:MAG: hypothetical protein CMQ17_12330 [Gammaproteobacteria bacterium]|jgi:hypothetical protein|nr:hypothetical protein [Gammaproteobacteria bacterium]MDP7455976.1 hypothetical protein [Gammaproteobacteria bacterium]|tara:strand:+ start:1420 stop:1770 length:351 start_codon:yes stop_codon:yes gene_type:complete